MTTAAEAYAAARQIPGLDEPAVQYLVTVGMGEGGWGSGWSHPSAAVVAESESFGLTGTEGAGSNNWGAVQGTGNAGSFQHVDHHADGSPYVGTYKRYQTSADGAADMAAILLKPNVRAALDAGDLKGAVFAQHDNRYFELDPNKYYAAVLRNYQTLTTQLGWEPLLTIPKAPSGAAQAPLPRPLPSSPETPAVHLPSPRSSWPASASPSFGQLSGFEVAVSRDLSAEARECAVFAASVELAEVEANAWSTERLRVYWRSALELPDTAHVDGYLHLAWCGVFALWALHQGGAAAGVKWVIGEGFVGPAKLHATSEPQPGDIAYKSEPYQHHAIVVAVEGDIVHTIDGNQGQTPIKATTHSRKDWTLFYSVAPLLPTNPPEAT